MKGKHYIPFVLALIVFCFFATLAYATNTDFDITNTYGYQQGYADGYSEGYAQGYTEGVGDGSWASSTEKDVVNSVQYEYATPINVAEALLHSISNMDVQGFITLCQWPSEAEAERNLSWIYKIGVPYSFEEMDWVLSYSFGNFDGVDGYLKTMKEMNRRDDNWTTHIDISYNYVRKVYTVGQFCYIGTYKGSAYLYVPSVSGGV